MATQIQLRRATAAEWAATDPILAEGEPGVDLTSGYFKIGNGVDPWSVLVPIAEGQQGPQGEQGPQGDQGPPGDTANTGDITFNGGNIQLPPDGDILDSDGNSVLTPSPFTDGEFVLPDVTFGPEVTVTMDLINPGGNLTDAIDTNMTLRIGPYLSMFNTAYESNYSPDFYNYAICYGTEWTTQGWSSTADLNNVTSRPYGIAGYNSVAWGVDTAITSSSTINVDHLLKITTTGTVNWLDIGASSTAVGTMFRYNGTSITGTGNAIISSQHIMHDVINDKYYTFEGLDGYQLSVYPGTDEAANGECTLTYVRRLINVPKIVFGPNYQTDAYDKVGNAKLIGGVVGAGGTMGYTLQQNDDQHILQLIPDQFNSYPMFLTIPTDAKCNFPVGTIITGICIPWTNNTDTENNGYTAVPVTIECENSAVTSLDGSNDPLYYRLAGHNVKFDLIKSGPNAWQFSAGGAGAVGPTGPTGQTGAPGPQGEQGLQGPAGSGLVSFQVLSSPGSGTWTPSSGVTKIMVVAIGGGGGSGRAVGSTLSNQVSGAGGSGAWSSRFITSVAVSYSYTVPGGGTADTTGVGGGAGATAYFVAQPAGTTMLTAPGGSGGVARTTTDSSNYSIVPSTAGGVASTFGQTTAPGNPSTMGICGLKTQLANAEPCNGGSTPWGPGGKGATSDGVGTTPSGYGGGAGGAYASSSTARSGAAGANGAILIWEYN